MPSVRVYSPRVGTVARSRLCAWCCPFVRRSRTQPYCSTLGAVRVIYIMDAIESEIPTWIFQKTNLCRVRVFVARARHRLAVSVQVMNDMGTIENEIPTSIFQKQISVLSVRSLLVPAARRRRARESRGMIFCWLLVESWCPPTQPRQHGHAAAAARGRRDQRECR